MRVPSPRNPGQKKTRVQIKRRSQGDLVYLLCRSDGREQKAGPSPPVTRLPCQRGPARDGPEFTPRLRADCKYCIPEP